MRHNVYGKKLSRSKNEREALFKGLVRSLILYGYIQTTEAKAKAIKGLVDKIISQAKNKDSKRLVQSYLTQKDVQRKLFEKTVKNLNSRTSGYTSMIKLGPRPGDGAPMVRLNLLVDQNKPDKSAISKPVNRNTDTPKSKKGN